MLQLLALWMAAQLGAGAETNGAAEPWAALPVVIGEARSTLVRPDETLLDVAFLHRLGFEALQRLNPDVDPWIPLPGTVVHLPTRAIPPAVDPEGLAINVPEMRLYDFRPEAGPEIFHVAIGDPEDPTLLGDFRVGEKRTHPAWRVPESIRRERPGLPAVVPAGPDNPLGDRWMTIGATSYGIHGTNVRWSIGRQATHGCVRLYADEMRRLYDRTDTGTRIQIVYQPFKWGREGDLILLEVHPDIYQQMEEPLAEALRLARELDIEKFLELGRVSRAVREARGVPTAVGSSAAERPTTSTPTS